MTVFRIILLSALFLSLVIVSVAQQAPAAPSPGIQDNSFLIEEAYNQEPGVIQHINFFSRTFSTHDWVYTFTQEWPVTGQKHQLSYTLAGTHVGGDFPGSGAGFGDIALNYRYQLVGTGETRTAVAPRLTVILPTGDERYGRGYGGTAVQTMLPLSFVVSPKLVTHWNAGATWIPNACNASGETASANGYALGQSTIWLANPRFNVMLETLWTGSEAVVGHNQTQRSHDLLISPGVRWAYNFKSGLQIVPGFAFPTGAGPSAGEHGVILYLSFEHPLAILGGKKK